MTISRAQVAHYLDSDFSDYAAAVAQTDNSDGDSGYGADIDNALRKLDKTEDELTTATVEDEDRGDYFALAEYYAARRFQRLLGPRVNVKVDDSQFDYRYMFENINATLEDAAKVCAALGYDVLPPAVATDVPATVRVKLTPVW